MDPDRIQAVRLDDDACYRAYLSKDRRFDGRFYTGVVTTGIYCRPTCPSPQPKRHNMRFFACAAAAQEAGFRACRRCRPETAPGTPAWAGTSAVVSRALRLIEQGALDSGSIDALAARVGLGGRQLRRLFVRHLGASPLSIALTRRLHCARILIDQTDEPMSRVALNAGFGSIRQFNHLVKRSFGATPSQLRRAGERRATPSGGRGLVIHLPYRPPFDWDRLLSSLAAAAIPGVERVTATSYCRSVESAGVGAVVELLHEPRRHRLVALLDLADSADLIQIVERIRRLCDLDADPLLISAALARDPKLARLIDSCPGLRIPSAWSAHEAAIWGVLEQDLPPRNVADAAARIAARYGTPLPASAQSDIRFLFPSIGSLAEADWTGLGLADRTCATLRAVARAMREGRVLDGAGGLEQIVQQLMTIPNISEDTAHRIAMRGCSETDALPITPGLRAALARDGRKPCAREIERTTRVWRPWRAYGAAYVAGHYDSASSAGRGETSAKGWRRVESL